jgi:hypothetical protein
MKKRAIDLPDFLVALGALLIVIGFGLWSIPAAIVVAGLCLIAGVLLVVR